MDLYTHGDAATFPYQFTVDDIDELACMLASSSDDTDVEIVDMLLADENEPPLDPPPADEPPRKQPLPPTILDTSNIQPPSYDSKMNTMDAAVLSLTVEGGSPGMFQDGNFMTSINMPCGNWDMPDSNPSFVVGPDCTPMARHSAAFPVVPISAPEGCELSNQIFVYLMPILMPERVPLPLVPLPGHRRVQSPLRRDYVVNIRINRDCLPSRWEIFQFRMYMYRVLISDVPLIKSRKSAENLPPLPCYSTAPFSVVATVPRADDLEHVEARVRGVLVPLALDRFPAIAQLGPHFPKGRFFHEAHQRRLGMQMAAKLHVV